MKTRNSKNLCSSFIITSLLVLSSLSVFAEVERPGPRNQPQEQLSVAAPLGEIQITASDDANTSSLIISDEDQARIEAQRQDQELIAAQNRALDEAGLIEEPQLEVAAEVIEQEVIEQEVIEQEVTEQEVTEQEVIEQEVTEQEVTEQEVTEQEVTEQEVIEQEVIEQEVIVNEEVAVETEEETTVAEEEVATEEEVVSTEEETATPVSTEEVVVTSQVESSTRSRSPSVESEEKNGNVNCKAQQSQANATSNLSEIIQLVQVQAQQAFMMLSMMKDFMQMQMQMMNIMPFAHYHTPTDTSGSLMNGVIYGMAMNSLTARYTNDHSGTYYPTQSIFNINGAPMQQMTNPATQMPYGFDFNQGLFNAPRNTNFDNIVPSNSNSNERSTASDADVLQLNTEVVK